MKTHLKTIFITLGIIIAVTTIMFLILMYKIFAIITFNLLILTVIGILYYMIYKIIKINE